MTFRLIKIPPFKAFHSGVDKNFDFSEKGKLGIFNDFFSTIRPEPKDDFTPRDYLYYDKINGGLVWMYAVVENLDTKDFPIMDFDGGMYVTYAYMDGDQEENERLYNEALKWIEASGYLTLDERENHYAMGHIITPAEVIKKTNKAQMESFIPVKLI